MKFNGNGPQSVVVLITFPFIATATIPASTMQADSISGDQYPDELLDLFAGDVFEFPDDGGATTSDVYEWDAYLEQLASDGPSLSIEKKEPLIR